ncbi:response regulator transcription factor [Nordella sp. HKS 07]|uniref:response regulator n=1 Tax=Nordella sp. HKS 07 TaxID=2712222 RepID=UPI0013E1F4B4|nr:response regulator transcription factor [Nordella sp. HKS 07]QIG51036.1 response regulator transcription factor [Nordella sp. HKS 07]
MNTPSIHIVVVDDEPPIRTLLRNCFEAEGYRVSEAATSEELFNLVRSGGVDLITLDLTLGAESGLQIARNLRTISEIPIIMVTGKGDLIDRVVGLELGADDYIAKPFHLREILARVRTVLRRADRALTEPLLESEVKYRFDEWELNLAKRELREPDGTLCPLTTAELDLLAVLIKRPGHVLSREAIMDQLKGHDWAANDRAIDSQISRLRKKLGEDSESLIKTVRGVGYSFSTKVTRTST